MKGGKSIQQTGFKAQKEKKKKKQERKLTINLMKTAEKKNEGCSNDPGERGGFLVCNRKSKKIGNAPDNKRRFMSKSKVGKTGPTTPGGRDGGKKTKSEQLSEIREGKTRRGTRLSL